MIPPVVPCALASGVLLQSCWCHLYGIAGATWCHLVAWWQGLVARLVGRLGGWWLVAWCFHKCCSRAPTLPTSVPHLWKEGKLRFVLQMAITMNYENHFVFIHHYCLIFSEALSTGNAGLCLLVAGGRPGHHHCHIAITKTIIVIITTNTIFITIITIIVKIIFRLLAKRQLHQQTSFSLLRSSCHRFAAILSNVQC